LEGHRVATRRRSSASCPSGTSTRNGRMDVASAVADMLGFWVRRRHAASSSCPCIAPVNTLACSPGLGVIGRSPVAKTSRLRQHHHPLPQFDATRQRAGPLRCSLGPAP
jgi:hypothetical protein